MMSLWDTRRHKRAGGDILEGGPAKPLSEGGKMIVCNAVNGDHRIVGAALAAAHDVQHWMQCLKSFGCGARLRSCHGPHPKGLAVTYARDIAVCKTRVQIVLQCRCIDLNETIEEAFN